MRRRGLQVVTWWLMSDDKQLDAVRSARDGRIALTESQGVIECASSLDEGQLVVPGQIARLIEKGVVDRLLVGARDMLPLIEALELAGPQNEQPPVMYLPDFIQSDEFTRLKKLKNDLEGREVRERRSWGVKRSIKRGIRWMEKRRRN